VKFGTARNAVRGSAVLTVTLAILLSSAQVARRQERAAILVYIKQTWHTLTRTNRDLASAAVDPKFHPSGDGRWPIYISRQSDIREMEIRLDREMTPSDKRKIELRQLPLDALHVRDQGLLYLPRPYVVPGGRFNEMYGWDSYFIQLGLLRDGDISLAQDMADNFLYEIRNYGKVLNANRTYYLTRSQPPFSHRWSWAYFKGQRTAGGCAMLFRQLRNTIVTGRPSHTWLPKPAFPAISISATVLLPKWSRRSAMRRAVPITSG